MGVLGNTITPGISDLRHVEAQGANTGDYAYGTDGGYYRWNGERWERESGGGGASGASGDKTAPAFKFDWEAARKAAFDPENPSASVLGRYYLQKLKDSGDDVTRAKRLLQEDYDRGTRVATEDYARTEKYGGEDLAAQLAELGLESTQERREAIAGANRRGTLMGEMEPYQKTAKAPYSEYAKEYILNPMEQRQSLRKQAIERAIQRQTEVAKIGKERAIEEEGIRKTRGFEEQNIQYPRTQQELQEQTRKEAYNIQVPQQYQEAYQKYRVSSGLLER